MPSLIRLFAVIGILAGLVYAGLWTLAHLVEPQPREMTITIPQERLGKGAPGGPPVLFRAAKD